MYLVTVIEITEKIPETQIDINKVLIVSKEGPGLFKKGTPE